MPRYRVVLPVEIDGKVYQFGAEVALDDAHAAPYAHALRLIEDEAEEAEGAEESGSNQ